MFQMNLKVHSPQITRQKDGGSHSSDMQKRAGRVKEKFSGGRNGRSIKNTLQ